LAVIYDAQGRGIDTNNPLPIKHSASDIIQPVEVQSKYASTIQTHNAVSIALSGSSIPSTWIDCDGFDKLACTMINDASTNSWANIYWSNDGTTLHGFETMFASNAQQQKSGIVDIKARYAKVVLGNADASLAHTMSAWAYLKA
jgi:hypothetical protein